MFIELLPFLKDRMVTITVARLDENILRVNVVPKRKSDKETDAVEKALSTPLTVTATAEELDREFAQHVLSFSDSYERAACNIREIEIAHASAVKAAEDEKKNAKGKKPSTTTPTKGASQPQSDSPGNGKPVFGNKTPAAPPPASQSLFDSQPSDPPDSRDAIDPQQSPQPRATGDAVMPAATEVAATATVESDSLNCADGFRVEPEAAAGSIVCQICQCAILPSQKRHSLMPFPAHASATECETARVGASAAGQSRE